MQLYYIYALGSKNAPREIIVKDHVENLITAARKSNQMLFLSYYLYDQEALEHLKIRKSIAGYSGTYYLDKLIFDLDDHENKLNFLTYKSYVLNFVEQLMEDWELSEDSIRIWFSGRGYHIETPDFFGFHNSNSLPIELKATLDNLFPGIDTHHTSANGMLRAPYTINPNVNLYKIPFDYHEYKAITEEQLLEIAKNPKPKRQLPLESPTKFYYEKIEKKKKSRKLNDTTEDYGRIVTCIQKMYNMNNLTFRHQRMLPMISTFMRNGMPVEATTILMKEWVKRQTGEKEFTDYEVERTVNNSYRVGYTYGCDDKYMKALCDPKCMFYAKKNYTMNIATIDQMDEEMYRIAQSDYYDKGVDLNKIWKLGHSFMFMPKDLIVFWGDVGLGKSSTVQNISIALPEKRILYLTLEVARNKMHRRNIQIAYNMGKHDVIEHYRANKPPLKEKLSHIKIIDDVPKISNMEKLILDSQAEIVIVDTVGRIELTDDDQKYYRGDPIIPITKGLRSIAKKLDVIMIVVHHVSKSAVIDSNGKRKKLTLHSGMGSSYLEQDADTVIAIEGDREDNIREINALKGRDDKLFNIKLAMIEDTFKMIQLL